MKTRRCLKRGHKPIRQVRRGIRDCEGYLGVASHTTEKRTICRRCGAVLAEPEETYSSNISSLKMDQRDWERLRTKGVIWNHGWTRDREDDDD